MSFFICKNAAMEKPAMDAFMKAPDATPSKRNWVLYILGPLAAVGVITIGHSAYQFFSKNKKSSEVKKEKIEINSQTKSKETKKYSENIPNAKKVSKVVKTKPEVIVEVPETELKTKTNPEPSEKVSKRRKRVDADTTADVYKRMENQ